MCSWCLRTPTCQQVGASPLLARADRRRVYRLGGPRVVLLPWIHDRRSKWGRGAQRRAKQHAGICACVSGKLCVQHAAIRARGVQAGRGRDRCTRCRSRGHVAYLGRARLAIPHAGTKPRRAPRIHDPGDGHTIALLPLIRCAADQPWFRALRKGKRADCSAACGDPALSLIHISEPTRPY